MAHESIFLTAIKRDPEDRAAWLAYADWLEERGDPRARFLRIFEALRGLEEGDPGFISLQAEKEKLRPQIDAQWQQRMRLLRVSRHEASVSRCELFYFQCPRRWNELRPTEDEAIRYCETCQERVYYFDSPAKAREQAGTKHCIALGIDRYSAMLGALD